MHEVAQDHALVGDVKHEVESAVLAWWEYAENAAVGWNDLAVLAGLRHRMGRVFVLLDDEERAERLWLDARRLTRDRLDGATEEDDIRLLRGGLVSVLEDLRTLYHRRGSVAEAAAVEQDLAAAHRAAGDVKAAALALAQVGSTMMECRDYPAALRWLVDAEEAFHRPLWSPPTLVFHHARTLGLLAEAHRHLGNPDEADRCARRAIEVRAAPFERCTHLFHGAEAVLRQYALHLEELTKEIAAVTVKLGSTDEIDTLATMPAKAATWGDLKESLRSAYGRLNDNLGGVLDAAGYVAPKPAPVLESNPLVDTVKQLCRFAEKAASAHKAPDVLAGLLDHSGCAFYLAEDYHLAENAWGRAVALGQKILARTQDQITIDRARAQLIKVLQQLSQLYHDWGILGRALNIELMLVDVYQRAGDRIGVAQSLTRLGRTMIDIEDDDQAEIYLAHADREYQALNIVDDDTSAAHAATLHLLATTYLRTRHPIKANRCEARAKALLDASARQT